MESQDGILGAMKSSLEGAHKRINRLEEEVKSQRELTKAVVRLAERVDSIGSDMEKMQNLMYQVISRPSKRWDTLIAAALGALASGVVARLLAVILL